jgi:AAA domain
VTLPLDDRPVIVALAGPNGAGKSTFYQAHLEQAGLRFINADDLAREIGIGPYEAAELADHMRRELVRQRESFVFETVLSDPVGDKVDSLREAAHAGYASCCVSSASTGRRHPSNASPCVCSRADTMSRPEGLPRVLTVR